MKRTLLGYAFCCMAGIGYAQNGAPDPTFGNQGIVATNVGTSLPIPASDGIQVIPQPGGSILLVFRSAGFTFIAKKNTDGSPDPTYGNNGISAPLPMIGVRALMQPDNKILISGHNSASGMAVGRFNANGTIDSTFDGDGVVTSPSAISGNAAGIALQTDGKIIVAGVTVESGGLTLIVLARYNPDGSGEQLDIYYSIPYIEATSVAVQNDGKIVVGGTALVRFNSNLVLDSTFNGTGLKPLPYRATDIAIQNDGKILICGSYLNSNNEPDFALSRYNSTGSEDNSFSNDGLQLTDFGGTETETATSLSLQADGKILLGGYTAIGNDIYFGVARYNSNGSPDNSFSGDGRQATTFGGSSINYLNDIAIQSDGRLLAVGSNIVEGYGKIAVARYNLNGDPDNTFGGDGTLTISEGSAPASTFYTATAVQADGKILAAGYAWNGVNYDFAIVRYNTNGTLDNTFSGDGKQLTDFGTTDRANAIAIQGDGKILVAGTAWDNFAIARYNTNGSLDVSFDGDGLLTSDFGGSDYITSIVIQADGKIVAAGTSLARYNPNGTPDLGFGTLGTVPLEVIARDVAIQSDGKILIAGSLDTYGYAARFNGNGLPDVTFGTAGVRIIFEFDYRSLVCNALAIQRDGKIVIGGYGLNADRRSVARFALLRLNADATRDFTFAGGEVVFTYFENTVNDYATSLIIQGDNKIVLAGYGDMEGADNFLLARYNPDGSPDNTFGVNGKQTTHASAGYDRILAIAQAGDNLYAAGYGQYTGDYGVVAKFMLNGNSIVTSGLLEAELALLGQVVTASNNPGFTGTGFADYTNNSGGYIEWTVNKAAAGQVALNFRYANGGAYNRPLQLEVNGVVVASSLAFQSTGSWTTWSASGFIASLQAGANRVRLTATGANGPNMDHLAWRDTILTAPPVAGILEAEIAELNLAVVASNNSGYTGTGFADYTNNSDDYIEWTLNRAGVGAVILNFRYALAGATSRPLRLEVNGVPVAASLVFPSTGSWTSWLTVQVTAHLMAGANKIRLTTIGSNGPNIDHLAWQNSTFGTLEAELAVLSQAVATSVYPGYTGTGFADYTSNTGGYIEWTLNKSNPGPVSLNFRYALGGTTGRPLRLEVNGVVVAASLPFGPTGTWATWSVTGFTANLIAGANTIRLTTIGSNGPNVDHLAWSDATAARKSLQVITLVPALVQDELAVTVSPNPSVNSFSLFIKTNNKKENTWLVITDISGKTIEKRNNLQPGKKIELGGSFNPGVYLVRIVQGNSQTVLKLIKGRY